MLRITAAVRDDIVTHARAVFPQESCGIIAGAGHVGTRACRMRNVDQSPISYTMDPKEQLLMDKQLRAERLEMLGIYHSHTATAAYPSPTDVRLATYPGVSYVLVSLKDQARPDVQSYRIIDGVITPESLDIVAAGGEAHV